MKNIFDKLYSSNFQSKKMKESINAVNDGDIIDSVFTGENFLYEDETDLNRTSDFIDLDNNVMDTDPDDSDTGDAHFPNKINYDTLSVEEALNLAKPMIKSMARKFSKNGLLDYEDALQESRMGFVEGFNHFDVNKGHALFLYAKRWMLHRLQTASSRNLLLHVPHGLVKETQSDYRNKIKGEESQRKYKSSDAVKDSAINVIRQTWAAERLDQYPEDKESFSQRKNHVEIIISENSVYADLSFDRKIDFEKITQGLSALNHQQRQVIYGRFYQDLTLDDVGKSMNISREAVRQLQERGLNKIRKMMGLREDGTPANSLLNKIRA